MVASWQNRPHDGLRDPSAPGRAFTPNGEQRPSVEVVVAMAFRMLHVDDPADIAALLRVDEIVDNGNVHEPHVIWAQTYYGIPIASAQQANVLADIRIGITNKFPEAMRQVIRIISDSGISRLPWSPRNPM